MSKVKITTWEERPGMWMWKIDDGVKQQESLSYYPSDEEAHKAAEARLR